MLRFLSAGESHGKCLVGILEGMVSHLSISESDIDSELSRRQKGYGRGKRMQIETDRAEILSGVRGGETTGAPISFLIRNADHENWIKIMDIQQKNDGGERYVPRPGHADLPGVVKYGFDDIRNIIERSSARETAARVAAGAICRKFLSEFSIFFYSRVIQLGRIKDNSSPYELTTEDFEIIEQSEVRNTAKEKEMKREIDNAQKKGESIGGVFEITARGLCPGMGSHVHWDRRLDASISGLLMSIPGVKGVEIGAGFGGMHLKGSEFHDEIYVKNGRGAFRKTNNAGGIEGGMTNGEALWIKCAMKPIPTLKNPLSSFHIRTMKESVSYYERSDTCAVIPAAVVAENFLAFCIADKFIEKFGGDSMKEVKANYKSYVKSIGRYWKND
ncbi:MAG TPA: chorismate synthase [bacterium]|nr:chorismate synthase [bacterium]